MNGKFNKIFDDVDADLEKKNQDAEKLKNEQIELVKSEEQRCRGQFNTYLRSAFDNLGKESAQRRIIFRYREFEFDGQTLLVKAEMTVNGFAYDLPNPPVVKAAIKVDSQGGCAVSCNNAHEQNMVITNVPDWLAEQMYRSLQHALQV